MKFSTAINALSLVASAFATNMDKEVGTAALRGLESVDGTMEGYFSGGVHFQGGHLFGAGYEQYDSVEIRQGTNGRKDVEDICHVKCVKDTQCTGFHYRTDGRYDGRRNGNCWFMSGEIKHSSPGAAGSPGAGVWIKEALEANCGVHGQFRLVPANENREEMVETFLENLDDLSIPSGTLSYHLHVTWDHQNDDFKTGSECGGAFTGGHYDPAPACGPASQAKADSPEGTSCDPAGYTCNPSNPDGCERGDLSGKYGKLAVTNGAVKKIEKGNSNVPALIDHFVEDNVDKVPGKFASVVFHEGGSGARLLCCKLVQK